VVTRPWPAATLALVGLGVLATSPAPAHWAGPTLTGAPDRTWWDGLASGRGLCCSVADGVKIEDVDWDSVRTPAAASLATMTCRYRVRISGKWVGVPDAAVVTVPNRFGPAVVWPYQDAEGRTQVRCFLPGAGT
jgi:hypothetical protein